MKKTLLLLLCMSSTLCGQSKNLPTCCAPAEMQPLPYKYDPNPLGLTEDERVMLKYTYRAGDINTRRLLWQGYVYVSLRKPYPVSYDYSLIKEPKNLNDYGKKLFWSMVKKYWEFNRKRAVPEMKRIRKLYGRDERVRNFLNDVKEESRYDKHLKAFNEAKSKNAIIFKKKKETPNA